jgi:predicted secreted protein
MSFMTGLLLYVVIWVVILFMVLPWGVHVPEKIEKGHATSAPENPYMGIKLLVTSLIAVLLWVVAYILLKN